MKPMIWSVGLLSLLSLRGWAGEPADLDALAASVRQLEADDYFVREQATQVLVEAGQTAIPLLAQAAQDPGLEKSARAIAVLGQLALSPDVATADAAEQVLDELSASHEPRIVGRAKTALRGRLEVRRDVALKRLQELGAIAPPQEGELLSVQLSGDSWKGTDADIQLLRWFPEMTVLICEGVTLGDEAFAFFHDRMELRQLRLVDTKISERGFAHVERLPKLLYFQGESVPLTDAAMDILAKHTQLQLLSLSDNAISDAGFAKITAFKNLNMLTLDRMPISDSGLAPLAELTSLESLALKDLPITNTGFQHVAALAGLQTLQLQNLTVDDEGLKSLANIPGLFFLELKHLPITSAGVVHVAGMPRLSQLFIKYCPVNADCLERLGQNPSLNRLFLFGTDIAIEQADAFSAAHANLQVDHRLGGFLGVIGGEGVDGCELQEVQAGTAADQAGLRVEDVITHYNGVAVGNFEQLRAQIRTMRAGETAEIRGLRDGVEFTKSVTLAEEPELRQR